MNSDHTLIWVRGVLAVTPQRWMNLITSLPAELLSQPPAPGEWSALECLQHMIDTETVFLFRLEAFKAGKDFPAFNPDAQGKKLAPSPSPIDLAAEFSQRRQQGLTAIDTLTPKDLPLRARHAELGTVTLGEMMNEWAAHDLNHTVQAERALMQPFIENCGPWINYFQDHVISKR